MKDYRSLEHKIRDMHEAKNSDERKKVVNVAREDDADPKSDKSKLAKQGEIKTKIIDETVGYESKESKNKPNETNKKDAKEIKGGKTEVELNPKTDDKIGDESDETAEGRKAKNKANKEIGAKGAKDVKEETAPKWDEKEFKLVHPGKWKHTSSDSSIHYGGDSKSYRVMHGNDSDPKKYNTLDGAQKAVRAKHMKEEVELDEALAHKMDAGELRQHLAKKYGHIEHGHFVSPETRNSYMHHVKRLGKMIGQHPDHVRKQVKKDYKHMSDMGEETVQVDEISSAMLYRAKQAAQKKASWLMPGDKGIGDKAWNRVRKFRDAGVAKQKAENAAKQKANEEAVLDEAYAKGYKSPMDKIEKAKPGISARIDQHAKELDDLDKKYKEIVARDKKPKLAETLKRIVKGK